MPRIFDNIDQSLLPALHETLALADRADFCVGYFNLRGWKQIDECIARWSGGTGHCCRLLVGMQHLPQEDLREALSILGTHDGLDNQTALRLKQKLAEEFRQQLMLGTPTNADEAGLRRLAAQIRAQKVIVKLFLRHPLHAKLYLLFRPDPITPAVGYLGSSNLTFAGLSQQGELNIDVVDHDACRKLAQWFEDRWEDRWCIDISKELLAIIEESWAREEPIPPYHIYLKMAYHLSHEARAGLMEFRLPRDFGNKLFDFQVAAVKIAAHHLNKRGGVLIGDVVGLGKTLMATAVARIFEDDQDLETLIICPRNLIPMWEDYRTQYRLRARVLPLSRVLQELPVLRRYRLVAIDESHNLRNREGKRYRAIQEYLRENESKVILLSATPYNKTYLDLSNQLRLFIAEDADLGIRPERMLREIGETEFIRRHQSPVRSLAAFEQSTYADDWRDLMRLYMVRRTRSFIQDNYAETDATTGRRYLTFADGTRSYFPTRQPKTLKFAIDDSDPHDQYAFLFEKYINQKQMGAYYSKEDITEYISKSTIIPRLFDAAQKACAIAFQPNSTLWQLLRDEPDRYIYEPVRKGVDLPLPEDIAGGIEDVSQRGGWNRPAAPALALPTETWREHISRRQRCLEVRDNLQAGEIHHINDLITYNLDVRQFAEDVISTCEGPELLRAFYQAISTVTVLDPTCGSGAFLFAALKILEPLYEACLDRMQAFVDDLERSGERHHPSKFSDFRRILAEVERHPNRRYFILKSIMVNNLYGVDIMEEAVEICKLRLFLKLVAQVDRVKDLEPLPDIDFNIRPGNTLVGFLSIDEIRRAAERDAAGQGRLVYSEIEEDIRRIGEDAEIVDRAFLKFHEMQSELGMNAREFAVAKQDLRGRLKKLGDELDRYLAGEYGIDPGKTKAYDQWSQSHQPFHWIAECYGTMRRGGFDVIIGNPPYLEKSRLGEHYSVKGLRTLPCRDIYAWMVERALSLRNGTGRLGLIIPVSVASSGSFDVLRDVVSSKSTLLWMAHFANRPSQLFVGAQNRLTILLSATQGPGTQAFSTCYHRWDGARGGRDSLFHVIRYVPLGDLSRLFHGLYPKIGDPKAAKILRKIANFHTISEFTVKKSAHAIFWVRVPGYFCQFFVDPPKARPEQGGKSRIRGEMNAICLPDPTSMRVTHALLNSSTYYQFFTIYTDGRHINPSDVTDFPFNLNQIADPIRNSLTVLSKKLEDAMMANTGLWRKSGLLIESVDSRPTKPIIDEIDQVLSQHYGFIDEEFDFIANYDFKFRVGQENSETNDE